MRSTGSDIAHRLVVDHLPRHLLQQLVAEDPGAKTVVVIISSETADGLGLAQPEQSTTNAHPATGVDGRRAALIRRRHAMGLTQEGLAHQIGVQTSTVGRWERGGTRPSVWARARLCAVLDVTPAELDALLEVVRSEPIRVLSVVEPSDALDAESATAVPASA